MNCPPDFISNGLYNYLQCQPLIEIKWITSSFDLWDINLNIPVCVYVFFVYSKINWMKELIWLLSVLLLFNTTERISDLASNNVMEQKKNSQNTKRKEIKARNNMEKFLMIKVCFFLLLFYCAIGRKITKKTETSSSSIIVVFIIAARTIFPLFLFFFTETSLLLYFVFARGKKIYKKDVIS